MRKSGQKIIQNLKNIPGFRTNRKIIVFESDDWGSIRMPSKNAYNYLLKKGIRVDLCPYNKYDNLASKSDWEAMFSILKKHTDYRGNHSIITTNTNLANPDFQKIKEDNFQFFHYKKFTHTIEELYPKQKVFNLWKQGIGEKLIQPQYHGREHINSQMWLELLKSGNKVILEAFDSGIYGLSKITSPLIQTPYLASLIFNNNYEKAKIENALIEGAKIFNETFGFYSTSFIAPLYTWDPQLEKTFNKIGIKYIQGSNFHKQYDVLNNRRHVKYHIMGSRNVYQQIYLHRNCVFEPSINRNQDNVSECLKGINSAFFWRKPAVISMHRLNFIGNLDEANRTRNLKLLDELLLKIRKTWPEVEFVSSDELGKIVEFKIEK